MHSHVFAGVDLVGKLVQQQVQQQLQSVLPPFKRSRTAYEAYSTLRTQDCDEVKLWNVEVRDAQVRVLLRLQQMCCICIKPKASLCASKSLSMFWGFAADTLQLQQQADLH